MMRSRSRWKAGRIASSVSLRTRPLLSALFDACGARISRSRCSSCSRIEALMRLPLCPRRDNLAQEAGAVPKVADNEVLRERLAQIRECRSRSKVHTGLDALAVQQE